ncbi:OB-fold nucleic acid binding domain-containing protein [Georgenia sp. SYP-B2076]|uniref:OB-fold nucleic acid binding domain-containing protein n=1 Tax=Georgenia sp. SYP-B2076 TaxID=2495881 RepID=UPI000F8E0701|nr:OB-fold nucleic acid binding domain-containing protein [Georgenia sp. SYP-B2076]
MSSRLGQLLHGLTASREELHADDERQTSAAHGATPVAELVPRRRAVVAGAISALTYRPRGQSPALVARLFDGSGSIDLVFLGRHDIPGIEPGRRLVAEGMVYEDAGHRTIFNPSYELIPRGQNA